MSEENNNNQTQSEENAVNNSSTEATENNVPYDRFQEVNAAKKDALDQVGKLQAQIDNINKVNADKKQAELVEQGKAKEALEIVTKERDTYKSQAEQWNQYQTDKRESLMSKLTDDTDKNIAEGLTDLSKLETYVNKVTNVSAPSTSTARAASGKAGDMGGYSSYAEWAAKDPKGYEAANNSIAGTNIPFAYTREE